MPADSFNTYNHGSVLSLRNSRHEANKAQSLRLDMCTKPMLVFMSSSCSQRALRFCSSVIRLLSHASPWNLCATGNLGSMESNVMAGRALFGRLQLPDGQRRCAIFLVQEKVMQGTSRAADYRAYRRIARSYLS